MITRAWEREMDLEMERKRKFDGVQTGSSCKKPKVSDRRSRIQQGRNRYEKYIKMHEGHAGRVVRVALSAFELVMSAGIVVLPPPP